MDKKLDGVLTPATLEVVHRYLSTIFKAAVDEGQPAEITGPGA